MSSSCVQEVEAVQAFVLQAASRGRYMSPIHLYTYLPRLIEQTGKADVGSYRQEAALPTTGRMTQKANVQSHSRFEHLGMLEDDA